MTQKTAIMQLIDSVKEKYDSLPQEGKNFADRFILVEAPQLLLIDKNQHIESYNQGLIQGGQYIQNDNLFKSGEQYYNQTYGQ